MLAQQPNRERRAAGSDVPPRRTNERPRDRGRGVHRVRGRERAEAGGRSPEHRGGSHLQQSFRDGGCAARLRAHIPRCGVRPAARAPAVPHVGAGPDRRHRGAPPCVRRDVDPGGDPDPARPYRRGALGRARLRVYPSDANFVLFVPPLPAAEVWQGLLDRGVLVRDLSSVVPNALRVTAGAEHEVDRFLLGLREVLT